MKKDASPSTPPMPAASHKWNTCPKCQRQFGGQGLGKHAPVCQLTMADLFWIKVNKDAPNGCWEWTHSRKEKGYGQFLWQNKMHRAHRLAWKLVRGEPGDKEVAHRCDNRICVNPDHLFLATHQENMADCKAKGRQVKGEQNASSKLTADQVRDILSQKPRGRAHWGARIAKNLAHKYGVDTGAINAIWRGRSWAHLREAA